MRSRLGADSCSSPVVFCPSESIVELLASAINLLMKEGVACLWTMIFLISKHDCAIKFSSSLERPSSDAFLSCYLSGIIANRPSPILPGATSSVRISWLLLCPMLSLRPLTISLMFKEESSKLERCEIDDPYFDWLLTFAWKVS